MSQTALPIKGALSLILLSTTILQSVFLLIDVEQKKFLCDTIGLCPIPGESWWVTYLSIMSYTVLMLGGLLVLSLLPVIFETLLDYLSIARRKYKLRKKAIKGEPRVLVVMEEASFQAVEDTENRIYLPDGSFITDFIRLEGNLNISKAIMKVFDKDTILAVNSDELNTAIEKLSFLETREKTRRCAQTLDLEMKGIAAERKRSRI